MEIDNANMNTQMKLQDRLFYETKKNEALIGVYTRRDARGT